MNGTGRGFHCLHHSLTLRALYHNRHGNELVGVLYLRSLDVFGRQDLSLCHNGHVCNLVDVLCLLDFDMLGRLVERRSRDLSLYHDRHRGNLVDVLRQQRLGILGHLVDRRRSTAETSGADPAPPATPTLSDIRVEEETAPTSEVGTGRPPPAWRHRKRCSCLSWM